MSARDQFSVNVQPFSLFQDYKLGVITAGLFSGVINLLMLAGPIYMLQVYDRVLTSKSVPTLIALTVLVSFVFVIVGILDWLRSRILSRIGQSLDETISQEAFLQEMNSRGKENAHTGSQPVRSLEIVRSYLDSPGPTAFFDAPWVPFYILILFLLHPWLGFFAAGSAVLLAAIFLLSDFLTKSQRRLAQEKLHSAHQLSEQCKQDTGTLRALGMLSNLWKRWRTSGSKAIGHLSIAGDRASALSSVSRSVRLFMQSAILGIGALLVISEELTPGAMIAASIILARGLAPLEQIISQWSQFHAFRLAVRELGAIKQNTDDLPETLAISDQWGDLTIEKLTIQSPETSRIILSGVNLRLGSGEIMGVIGPTGSGKSVLVKALLGEFIAAAGAIKLGSLSADQWNYENIGKRIGYCPQSNAVLSGSVCDYICRFEEGATLQNALDAARAANIHDAIELLPEGYKTCLGRIGRHLSAGQMQYLKLARAFYGNPSLLILDEPGAGLDAEGEIALIQALQKVKEQGASVILVSHRPSLMQLADKILVLKQGRQQAFGPAKTVMQQVLQPRPVSGFAKAQAVSAK